MLVQDILPGGWGLDGVVDANFRQPPRAEVLRMAAFQALGCIRAVKKVHPGPAGRPGKLLAALV